MVGKMAIFGTKEWVNPSGKISSLTFWTCCFYSLERGFFAPEYRKTDKKKMVGKMAIFGTKEWVNPSGKISSLTTF